MDYVIWMSSPVKNACWLDPIEKFDRSFLLPRGRSLADIYPSDAFARMDKAFKKNTALTDDLRNANSVKVCSPNLVGFLQRLDLKNLEYLPLTILDHKGKVAAKDYHIVNPLGLQDALDLAASKPEYNPVTKHQIDRVERIVLDIGRLEPGIKIFRLKGLYFPVFIARDVAKAIQAAGFAGPYFQELADYGL